MLPQPRLRFLLADDPGAGKTIMAGLLIKELKLREAIDRCLILVPAPLIIQWQDELLRFFNESFQIIHSANDQQQLLNLWERESQVYIVHRLRQAGTTFGNESGSSNGTSSSSTKLTSVAPTRSARPDEATRSNAQKRYQLAERLAEHCDNLLLLTATPHHGDDDRFCAFSYASSTATCFPEPHRSGQDGQIRREILQTRRELPVVAPATEGGSEGTCTVAGYFRTAMCRPSASTSERRSTPSIRRSTAFINEYLPQTTGASARTAFALARTVFPEALSQLGPMRFTSLYAAGRKKLDDLLKELEDLPPSQRFKAP